MSEPKLKTLICCCCGRHTKGRQWWNRDTGYGLCDNCIESCGVQHVKRGEQASAYGIRGKHWDVMSKDKPDHIAQRDYNSDEFYERHFKAWIRNGNTVVDPADAWKKVTAWLDSLSDEEANSAMNNSWVKIWVAANTYAERAA